MSKQLSVGRWYALHPFLLGLFPILFFYSQNAGQLRYTDIFMPAAIGLGMSMLWILGGLAVCRSVRKSTLFASLGLFLFFSYGHFFSLINDASIFGVEVGRHRYMLLAWAGLFLTGIYALIRAQRELREETKFVNVASGAVVALSLLQIGFAEVGTPDKETGALWEESREELSLEPTVDKPPNIYYIVPDGYARSKTLSRVYGFDNSDFEEFLENKGFYVADKSRSNYPQTFLSLASSLNMRYLDTLSRRMGTSRERSIPNNMIENSRVMNLLHAAGYRSVHFNSGWSATDDSFSAHQNITCYRWWEKEIFQTLIKSTVLHPFRLEFNFGKFLPSTSEQERLRCVFDTLRNLEHDSQGPFFAFAHLIIPHPPLGGGEEGENPWKVEGRYRNRVQVVNQKLEDFVREIVSNSQRQSVILIQGDHGSLNTATYPHPLDSPPKSVIKERTSIFNAYYLPSGCKDRLYRSISPVNSFRVVLNCYFDANFNIRPDKIYFSSEREPYKFENVTNVQK